MRSLRAMLAVVLIAGSAGPAWAMTNPPPTSVSPALLAQLAESGTGRFVVVFSASADLDEAAGIDDFTRRGTFVVDELAATATASQARALDVVADAGASAESYWVRNTMVVDGDADLAETLGSLPGVVEVRPERIFPLVEPVDRAVVAQAVGTPEWGVDKIGAPSAWESGVLGGGIVIANIDTGVEYTHPALSAQYRGNAGDGTFSHDYNWFDPTGICGAVPCDNAGHGTHTMGTMVGGDGPGPFEPDIGVAPGARWIAAKGCEDFGCSESALLAAGQWVLAPTDTSGANPDPSRRPDIVNNSWGGGPGDTFYLDMVTAWRAAGIVPVFSSGNPGPECGAGGSPGDYNEALSVGATDVADVIAEFSGRGPSVFGKGNPNVSAPGVDVISSVPGGGYESLSGTSMAAPHVAGTLALMMSAAPELIGDIDAAQSALQTTALDIIDTTCGGDDDGDPNNVYGEGRIDAAAAVNLVATGGTLEGTVTDAAGSALGGARVAASNGEREFSTLSADDGTFRLFLGQGMYTVSASIFGYESALQSGVEIVTDQTTTVDFALSALPTYTVSGSVLLAENGSGVPGATITALGTPVDPVTTDRAGRFRMTLPLGTYTLEATQGGCTTPGTAEVVLTGNAVAIIKVTKKIDDFGHGCAPIRTRVAEGRFQTSLYGDDSYGRLRLPFEFPFYDASYSEVFPTTNGYVTFTDPLWPDFFNTAIPNPSEPNAAVYALWQDLSVTGTAEVSYAQGGRSPNRWFVIDYEGMTVLGGSDPLDIAVRLWENGDIDLAYGAFTGSPGNGSAATVGIESADGSDGLQFGFREPYLRPNTTYRYTVVPTGVVSGVVVNANDGGPVAGATITADPSGRSATTDSEGRYSLRLVPGSYVLTAAAPYYTQADSPLTVAAGSTPTVDFSLTAAVAVVEPEAIAATTPLGSTTTETVTVTNAGSATLEYEVRERATGATPVELPPAEGPAGELLVRPNVWAPYSPPEGSVVPSAAGVTYDGPLDVIIDDPDDDAQGNVEVTAILAGSDDAEASFRIETSPSTPMGEMVGFLFLDTDQDTTTGISPEELSGLPTQELGVDYFVDLFSVPFEGVAYLVDTALFEIVAEIPAVVDGQSLTLDVPLAPMGDDGSIDAGAVIGNFEVPTDWAPDVGKGTVEPFRDAPWMAIDPTAGSLEPGESAALTVTLGGDVDPADYTGQIAVITNDPRTRTHLVDVALTVSLPDGFGSVSGTVTNARLGFPIPATVSVAAELDGAPYPIEAQADDSGAFRLYGPAGTWPVTITSEGYETLETELSIADGGSTTFDPALEPAWPFATLDGAPITVEIEAGASAEATLTLGNVEGNAALEFTVAELGLIRMIDEETAISTDTDHGAGSAVTAEIDANQALVVMDVLPWESDAIQQLLELGGVSYDVAGSAELPDLDLTGYEAVFVANDQPQEFYGVLEEQIPSLEAYVDGGGFLWLGVAGWGWAGGDPTGLPLPGGGSVGGLDSQGSNLVTLPDHPLAVGLPNPFTGTDASHTTMSGYPAGSVIATTPAGDTTLVEYDLGAGRVVVVAQPVEFGWSQGQDTGTILANGVPYALGFEPFTDVPWLSVSPVSGTVAIGDTAELAVTLDAADLEPGVYEATIVVLTNDPGAARLEAPVTLTVS